ncbi:MAG TPA: D-glycerate dehydrogenase [Vicinamibacterales bacterium]|nr:D-glycerate dehydrogenase [Vicinamibacterales bacterium]
MDRPPILVTRRLPSSVIELLERHCDVEMNTRAASLPHEELVARVPGKRALVSLLTDRIDRELLEAGRDLRIVANVAVGYDNVDLAAARERGVVVTNTPDVLTGAVAEFTWGLILAATRRIAESDRVVRSGQWRGWGLDYMLGMELEGKQLGIVGLGRIGRAVAARAPAFGMSVAYYDRMGPAHDPPAKARSVSFDELLVGSDVVSIHTPLTAETSHLFDRRALARMKRSAYLVNTSRGPVVDEEALAWALREGLLAGAALDVYEREPQVHPDLLALNNVVLAAHLGSATRETRTAMAELAARNVIEVLNGRPALTAVT